MTPAALRVWQKSGAQTRQLLQSAQYFVLTERITRDCGMIAGHTLDKKGTACANGEETGNIFEFKTPGIATVLNIGPYNREYLILSETEGNALGYGTLAKLFFIGTENLKPIAIIKNKSVEPLGKTWTDEGNFIPLLFFLDAALSAIAEPRLVEKRPPARQARKRALRALGAVPLPAWHVVTWSVGETTRPKRDSGREDWRAPLHFSRAHWRRADGSEPRAQRRDGKPGWWIWVSSSWKGHPDFGVKLHHYVPRAEGERFSAASLPAQPAAGLDATNAAREAAISAWTAQQAAKRLTS